ncbi:hypothetical protein [Streptomyces sp. SID13031]|uniref:NACHT domain-containing protein n=1 Tax=Streptomyces sp. SID13031 TaxID=2706046 RepID=UPI0013CD2DAE|nr:hypothetical protein [Streptomyces sp. SID13031]NEA30795.1 hypothetical protein [Streptomyces sp. SID13031]
MARSPFTFAGALDLADPDRNKLAGLDKVLGGAILAGGASLAIAGAPVPVIGLTAATLLGLVDPKNEAVRFLSPLVDKVITRIRGGRQDDQYDLVVAAHTITVLSSYFDALREVLGESFTSLQLTQQNLERLAGVPQTGGRGRSFVEALVATEVPLPSTEFGVLENLDQRIVPYYRRLTTACFEFFAGLDAWERGRGRRVGNAATLSRDVTDRAATVYRGRMLSLSTGTAFALWVTLNEHAATRATVRAAEASALGELRAILPLVLRGVPAPAQSYRAQLALAAQEVLTEPLVRSGTYGLVSPTVEQGFVEPAFQLAVADTGAKPADEDWWRYLLPQESLVDYLAGYLADESSTELPLLLLGHPGAGKSLLTEVLAAQLPSDSFAVLRVPLRRVNTDDELAVQITKELQRTLQRPQADLAELRAECGDCPDCRAATVAVCTHQCRLVILLDGFDELIQATGVTQSGYLNKIVEFQKRARTLGVPTSVIITSRTVVAEHADIPRNTPILKLCEFDEPRIEHWLTAWNAAHRDVSEYQPLEAQVLTRPESVAVLACQPLLLLVLAIYLAEVGPVLLEAGVLTQTELYREILDRFISRQVVDKRDTDLDPRQQKVLEALQRKQLQFAAIGMFNRGRQHLTDTELDADLAALLPQPNKATETAALRQAHRVLGAFMFVHNAKADQEQRGAYEFLHATFGEYLVAELTFEQLLRLDAHRTLEADELTLGATQLDDLLLRRVLSHQPLSSRRPIITFLVELTRELDEPRRTTLLATITELIQAARTRPDVPDDLYRPSPYDPIRHRAAYSANLTLLRVLLDMTPVRPATVIGSRQRADWESHVRLWRVGLDEPAWLSVIDSIGAAVTTDLQLCARSTDHRGVFGEAELLGNRGLMADLYFSAHRAGAYVGEWSEDDLHAVNMIASIGAAHTGVPYLGQLLPVDLGRYLELARCLEARTSNGALAVHILKLLSRDAQYLPVEVVEALLNAVHSMYYADRGPELAAVAAAHPSILRDNPAVREAIRDVNLADGTTVVALFWLAAAAHSGHESDLLTDLLEAVDTAMAAEPGLRFRENYFAPQFLTYLRKVRPAHWYTPEHTTAVFDDLGSSVLASIDPEDVLNVAESWPTESNPFLEEYLTGRRIDPDDRGSSPLSAVQRLIGYIN